MCVESAGLERKNGLCCHLACLMRQIAHSGYWGDAELADAVKGDEPMRRSASEGVAEGGRKRAPHVGTPWQIQNAVAWERSGPAATSLIPRRKMRKMDEWSPQKGDNVSGRRRFGREAQDHRFINTEDRPCSTPYGQCLGKASSKADLCPSVPYRGCTLRPRSRAAMLTNDLIDPAGFVLSTTSFGSMGMAF